MYRNQELDKGLPLTEASGLSDGQFAAWAKLLEQEIGVVIGLERKSFLAIRLRRRMRALRIESFEDYFVCVTARETRRDEWPRLVDEITIHETEFFRSGPVNDYLEMIYLPQRLARKGEDGFHAWSIGCASGEEAYTLAMLIDAQDGVQAQETNFGVTATDISTEALARARRGRYGCSQLRRIPDHHRDAYCSVLDADQFEINSTLRRRVCFVEINMLDLERFTLDGVDLISCQNVLMYFARPQRLRMLSILAERLAPGGLLVLGTSDIPHWSHPGMVRVRRQGMLAYVRDNLSSEEAKEQA